MADTTQDLVDMFSSGPSANNGLTPASAYAKRTFDDDKYLGIGTYADPLDDTTELRSNLGHFPGVTLPPTPKESPLKMNMDRLRGSPIKTPRRQFRTPKQSNPRISNELEIQENSPFLATDFDVDFDPQTVLDHGVVSGTKHLGGYQTLLLLSTDKLTRELHLERVRNGELEREVEALRRENFEANRMKTELESLKKQNDSLRSRNFSLELQVNNFQRHDKSEQLVKENKLLREKLLKYKNLYDSSMKTKNDPVPQISERSRELVLIVEIPKGTSSPKLPRKQAKTPQQRKRVGSYIEVPPHTSEEELEEELEEEEDEGKEEDQEEEQEVYYKTPPVSRKVRTSETLKKSLEDSSFIEQLRLILESLESRALPKKKSQPAIPETLLHPTNKPEEVYPKLPPQEIDQHELLRHNYSQPPEKESQKLPEINEPTNIRVESGIPTSQTQPQAQHQVQPQVQPQVQSEAYIQNPIHEAQPQRVQLDCKDQFSRLEHILTLIREDFKRQYASRELPSSAESNPQSCDSARPNTPCDVKTCAACSSAAAIIRPQSQSTPKESNNTQELMGKFLWNQTV